MLATADDTEIFDSETSDTEIFDDTETLNRAETFNSEKIPESGVESAGKSPFSNGVLANVVTDIKQVLRDIERDNQRHRERAGKLLIKAKKHVAHGKWSGWLKDNFDLSERTARLWMQLVKLPEEERQRVADMPLRDAARMIATPRSTMDARPIDIEGICPVDTSETIHTSETIQPSVHGMPSRDVQKWKNACATALDAIQTLIDLQGKYEIDTPLAPAQLLVENAYRIINIVTDGHELPSSFASAV